MDHGLPGLDTSRNARLLGSGTQGQSPVVRILVEATIGVESWRGFVTILYGGFLPCLVSQCTPKGGGGGWVRAETGGGGSGRVVPHWRRGCAKQCCAPGPHQRGRPSAPGADAGGPPADDAALPPVPRHPQRPAARGQRLPRLPVHRSARRSRGRVEVALPEGGGCPR